ncbi:hypothetical protein IQ277_36195 [Nostocales cyanobacterium LEGE 12452]|nr:hypothetical protein [Nostocales cyanobacterium LEGE 12452]
MLSPYSIAALINYPKITDSLSDVGYWSDEWGVGGKSGVKIQEMRLLGGNMFCFLQSYKQPKITEACTL